MQGIAEKFINIAVGGGSYAVPLADQFSMYLFRGTGTLIAPYTVTAAATPSGSAVSYTFFYNATMTTSGANVVSFFGVALSAQQALRGKLLITCTYDLYALAWAVNISDGTGLSETHNIEVSFSAALVGDFKIKMGYAGVVNEIYAYATEAIAAVDAGTITAKNNAAATMTGGIITYPLSSVRGTVFTNSITANNSFIAGDVLTLTTDKVTPGGSVLLSIKTTRTP